MFVLKVKLQGNIIVVCDLLKKMVHVDHVWFLTLPFHSDLCAAVP